jgi:hypothetical protein
MARIHVLCDDLLFSSRLQAAFAQAGHEVSVGLAVPDGAEAIVADLTHEPKQRLAALDGDTPTLAFYSHVESEVRMQAIAAGVALVVPRSRMAREPVALVERLLATGR